MKKAIFLRSAEDEMTDAADYYESQVKGLGSAFLLEVREAVNTIEIDPEMWAIVRGNVRRRLVRRFPYSILYKIESSQIVIIAVMHLHRNPNYWHDRINA